MATEVASLTALLSLDDTGFRRGMQNAENQIQRAGGSLRGIGTGLQSVGSSLTSVGSQFALATAPIAAFGVAGVAVASQYQDALTEIQVRAGLTADELDAVRETTLRLGQETQYGPGQAADAFLQLMTSGYDANQAMQAIDTVMAGAAATGADLGYTADALTDIMAAMGLGVEDSAEVMQTLVNATSASSATFPALVDGFGNVGPVAANFGMTVEDVAATLAVFAENGIKGAEGGTQLRSMLNNMTRPTEAVQRAWDALGTSFYNADGTMRPLDDVIADINRGLADKSPQEAQELITALAGTYGQMGLSALLATGGIDGMLETMEGGAGIQDVANARLSTFSGAMSYLQGTVETLMINALIPFMDNVLAPLIMQVTEVINQFTQWYQSNEELGNIIVMVLGALVAVGPVLIALGMAASVAGTAIAGIGAVLGFILSPIGLIIAAVGLLAAAFITDFGGIRTYFEANILPWFGGLWDSVQEGGVGGALDYLNNSIVTPLVDGFQSLISGGEVWEQAKSFGASILDAIEYGVTAYIDFVTWVWETIGQPIANEIMNYIGSGALWDDLVALGAMFLDAIAWGITAYIDIITWVWNNIGAPIAAAVLDYIGSGQLWDDLVALGAMFLDALAYGITLLKSINEWFVDNVIVPMGLAVMEYVGSGALWDDLTSLGASILDGIANGLGSVATWAYDNIVQPIIDQVSSIDIGSFIGGLNPFGGGRANGGPVSASTPYVVGERGPELFVPSSSGSIVPNEGMGPRVQIDNITINAPSGDGAAIARSFESELFEIMRSRG